MQPTDLHVRDPLITRNQGFFGLPIGCLLSSSINQRLNAFPGLGSLCIKCSASVGQIFSYFLPISLKSLCKFIQSTFLHPQPPLCFGTSPFWDLYPPLQLMARSLGSLPMGFCKLWTSNTAQIFTDIVLATRATIHPINTSHRLRSLSDGSFQRTSLMDSSLPRHIRPPTLFATWQQRLL